MGSSGRDIRTTVAWATTAGLRFRQNQDAILVDDLIVQGEGSGSRESGARLLVAVADGLAVSPCAQRASRTALELIRVDVAARPPLSAATLRSVQAAMASEVLGTRCESMACTIAALAVDGDKVVIVHAGDCRVYRFRDGTLAALTEDHTILRRMIREGDVPDRPGDELAAAYSDPDSALVADMHEREFEIGVRREISRDGDVFILATDGLTACVDDARIAGLARGHADVSRLASILVSVALSSTDSEDNVSVVVVQT